MSHIAISGYYGFGNAGDEAILASMVAKLRLSFPEIGLTVISRNPDSTRSEHNVDAVGRFEMPRLLSVLTQSDLLLMGGGSLLQDVTSVRSLAYYLGVMLLAKSLGKRVMLFANGFGPVTSPQGKYMARRALNRIDLATFRDQKSFDEVRELGVLSPHMELTADPVFLLDGLTTPTEREQAVSAAQSALQRAGMPLTGGPVVGISIRPWKHASPAFVPSLRQAVQRLATAGARVLLLPLHPRDDLEFCEQVSSGITPPVYVLRDRLGARAMMSLMSSLDAVVGMRLHALIFAVSQAVPCSAIPYDPKVSSLVEALDLPVATTVTEPDSEAFVRAVDYTLKNRDKMRQALGQRRLEQKALAERNFELVANLLGLPGRM